jgi:hypothetical protein
MKHIHDLSTRFRLLSLTGVLLVLLNSCDYLDVVPDNTPTIDHAFKNRHEALGFLYGCYSFLPAFNQLDQNPAILGWDEAWFIEPTIGANTRLWHISLGEQGTNTPYANYWSSRQYTYDLQGGKALWTAIRDCNLFIENIGTPFDLPEDERIRWTAEAKFLKAYFHFWMFRMYGPIPIVDENLPLVAKGIEVQLYRQPVDDVVEYIAVLFDEAAQNLPDAIGEVATDLGRVTKPIALAMKAQVLTYAASPLFNGSEDEAPSFSLIDNRGVELFPQTYDASKWQRAAAALKEAIDAAHAGGHTLFDFRTSHPEYARSVSEATILAMQVRGAVTTRWNSEIVWGSTMPNTNHIQYVNLPLFYDTYTGNGNFSKSFAPTLAMVESFYTKNGVPIGEDAEWQGVDLYAIQRATDNEVAYMQSGFETIKLHFNREPRFYGSITFDGGTFYGNGRLTSDNVVNANKNYMWMVSTKAGQLTGLLTPEKYPCTGYLCKKVISINTTVTTSSLSLYQYTFPIIRLADLYLMYAEALNEASASPDTEVYEYIDRIRIRTGLEGVTDSWSKYATADKKNKPLSKAGMREIIRQERMIELAFEGIRYWDLRRWKLSEKYWNTTIRGLNARATRAAEFYQVIDLYESKFTKKDYFWPIRQSELLNNRNLIQNVGWAGEEE